MTPIIALVGRPNVGKSTLFNRLTKTRNALVADQPGLTRDRIYGTAQWDDRAFIVIDTAGLSEVKDDFQTLLSTQSLQAVSESNVVFFLVDGRSGLTAADELITQRLRQMGKRCFLVVNKTEGLQSAVACAEFQQLGLGDIYSISATHGTGVHELVAEALSGLIEDEETTQEQDTQGIKIAVIGRPNVGKSTLVNCMLGEDRVVVFDDPGTTRDSVYIPFERDGAVYTLIDTAGVRRRGRINELVEKFSVVKTLQAIEACHVVLLVIDASEGVTDQDLSLAGSVLQSGRALVITLNKWDGLSADQRSKAKTQVNRKLHFLNFARMHYISALHGSGVGHIFKSVTQAYQSATRDLTTSYLNSILNSIVTKHPPPLVRGRRIKLRYAHQGGKNPPTVIIHGNQTTDVPADYRRYLANTFRDVLSLQGTPVQIEFRSGENPFKGRRNKLTPRQVAKKKRLKRFVNRKNK